MSQLPSRRHHYLPLGIGLMIGGGLCAIAAFTIWHWELKEAQHQFEEQSNHLTQHLQTHLDEYIQVTNALGIFYNASDQVTREDFKAFARPWLQDYPGILGLAWTPRITSSEFFPITYGEPPKVYQSILGFNLDSVEVLRNALEKARDSGEITASQSLGLLSGETGFILFNPVYRRGTLPTTPEERRQEFMGVVYTVYELPNLVKQALQDLPYHQLNFFLFDTTTEENQRLGLTFNAKTKTLETFNEAQNSFSLPQSCRTLFDCERSLTVADHQWSLMIIPDFNPLFLGIKPGIIFLVGLILTALLEAYLWRMLTEKVYIEQLVKQRTSELRQTTDNLEIRVQERTAQLEAAIQGKNELLGHIGHEFRTPLTIILGFIDLLERDRSLTSQQQENLKIMRRSGEYLLTLFNDILEISKLETHRDLPQPRSFNLHRLVETVIEIVQLKAQAKNLSLVSYFAPGIPQYIKADESKLRQILINLLDNAIKFTDKGTITLRLESDNQSWLVDNPSTSDLSQGDCYPFRDSLSI